MEITLKSYKKKNNLGEIFVEGNLKKNLLCYELNENSELQIIRNVIIELETNLLVSINSNGKIDSIELKKYLAPVEKTYTVNEFLGYIEPLFDDIKRKILLLPSLINEKNISNLNNKLTFVTCFYHDLFETEFGGRPNPYNKYLYGIESALKMGSPYIIYTWEKNVKELQDYYSKCLGEDEFNKRVKILPYDLYDTPIRKIIKKEKLKPQNQDLAGDRSFDVMLGKFIMLKEAINSNYFESDNFFWIDAGLSHQALFPNKYLDNSQPEKMWTECTLFTPQVPITLNKLCEEKIVLIKNNSIGYWFNPNHLPNSEGVHWYIIAGIFGGEKNMMQIYCDKILSSFIRHIEDYSMMYYEECIMTIEYAFNKNDYTLLEFECWHHEDSGEWVQDAIKNLKNFYKIFEELNIK